MDLSEVTRVEVIDYSSDGPGRPLIRHGVSVKLSLQDDGRTLKVFLGDSAIPPETVRAQIADALAAAFCEVRNQEPQ